MLRFSLGLFMVHLVVSLFLYLVNVILVSKVFSASYVTGLAKLVTLVIQFLKVSLILDAKTWSLSKKVLLDKEFGRRRAKFRYHIIF